MENEKVAPIACLSGRRSRKRLLPGVTVNPLVPFGTPIDKLSGPPRTQLLTISRLRLSERYYTRPHEKSHVAARRNVAFSGGGGNRTRVREQSAETSTGVVRDSSLAEGAAPERAILQPARLKVSCSLRWASLNTSLMRVSGACAYQAWAHEPALLN